jgi:cytidylate kinase
MFVCTIAAQAGTAPEAVAAALVERTGARLLDRDGLLALAHAVDPEVDDLDDIEERLGSRLSSFAIGLALSTGAPAALREFELHKTIGALGRKVFAMAVKESSVIVSPGGFAVLEDHPSAVHVRLRAPFEWRVDAYRRAELVDRRCAERAVKHDDHVKHAWVKELYHRDVDDPAHFSLVVDASRVPTERVAEAVLAAAGVERLAVA